MLSRRAFSPNSVGFATTFSLTPPVSCDGSIHAHTRPQEAHIVEMMPGASSRHGSGASCCVSGVILRCGWVRPRWLAGSLFGGHLLGRGAERPVSVGTTIPACTTARIGPDERRSPVFRRVLLMTVTIPSLPRRQVNWWAISAGIVMVGYACIAGVVFVLWGAVGFFVPGIDYPHPTLAQQVPVLVAGTTSLIGPRVGRVETDERIRLTVSARASVRCRRRPRGARR